MNPAEQHQFLRAVSVVRNYETEALSMLRLQDYQAEVVRNRAPITLDRGGTRSGKSLVNFAIAASTFTGMPLLDKHGRPLPPFIDHKGPHTIWTIGYGEKHIGQTIHRYLFRPGAFKIIPDQETGELRAYRPWDAADRARRHETRPAPPLIPSRFILGGEPKYSDRARNIFEHAEGLDGTYLYAFTSTGDVKMGDPVTFMLIDEDVKNSGYVPEWISRLEDPWARMLWGAFPWAHTTALRMLSRQAEVEAELVARGEKAIPDVAEFVFKTPDNAHIDDEVKKRRSSLFLVFGEAELAARDRGEFNDDLVEMYPNFSHRVHATPRAIGESEDPAVYDDPVDAAIRKANQEGLVIPDNWSLDVIVDPGHSHPGALVCAIVPKSLWPELRVGSRIVKEPVGVVVGEYYQPCSSAIEMALAIRNLLELLGNKRAQRHIIDWHAGRQSYQGMGGFTVMMHYAAEFGEAGLSAVHTGGGFQWSSDNVSADLMEVRRWLMPVGEKARPRLRYLRAYCPKFAKQMENYKKRITKDVATDEPANGDVSPLCDCVRYWVASRPRHSVVVERMQTTDAERRWKLYESEYEDGADDDEAVYCGVPRRMAG